MSMPLSGKVIETNPDVMDDPGLINRDPYGEGWLVIIEPSELEAELSGLVHGEATQPWLEKVYQEYTSKGLLASD